jgi:hypothetical protein
MTRRIDTNSKVQMSVIKEKVEAAVAASDRGAVG